MQNFDWQRAWRHGAEIAPDYVRSDATIDDNAIVWALLCEAIKTARLAYTAPPRRGWPTKSAWPDFPPEVTEFARIRAYLSGELEEMPTTENRPPMPDAAAVSRAEAMLAVWHKVASTENREWAKRRKAVYAKAEGWPDRKVRGATGYAPQEIRRFKRQAVADMLKEIARQR